MTAIIVLLSCLLAAVVGGGVIAFLQYRKVSKATKNVNEFIEEGKVAVKNVENDVGKMRQTADNVNMLVNDGRGVVNEINNGVQQVKNGVQQVKQEFAQSNIGKKINSLLDIDVSQNALTN